MNRPQHFSNWLTFLSIFALFSCSLVVNKFVNSCFYVIILLSIARLVLDRQAARRCRDLCRQYWPLCLAMAAPVLALTVRELATGEFMIRLYDLPARLALFTLVFFLIAELPTQHIARLKWGFALGTVLYTIVVYVETRGGIERIPTINSFSIIFSSELGFLMGMFSILSIYWKNARSPVSVVLLALAGVCGLYAVYMTQTRGAWLAIPVFAVIAISTFMHARTGRTLILIYVGILAAMLLVFSGTSLVQDRIDEAQHELIQFTDKDNLDTAVGVRLQLWKASWIVFTEHPLLGIGKENFSAEMQAMHRRGIITDAAAVQFHSHDETLYAMATMGLLGLAALLALYIAPLAYFGRYMFDSDLQVHSAAAMGVCLCTGYMIFGLVDVMFGWNMCNVFYSVAMALFMAFIVNKKNERQHQP